MTSTNLAADLSSREIDSRVRNSAASGHSLHAVDAVALRDLRPDLVITQQQCKVCALTQDGLVCALDDIGVAADRLSLSATNFDQLYEDILRVGSATGRDAEAASLVGDLACRLDRVALRTSGAERPNVFCLSWFDPLMTAGSWISNMVERAGGNDLLGTGRTHSTAIAIEQVRTTSPDVILLTPCSFSQERTRQEWLTMSGSATWRQLSAVRQDRVFTVESSLMHRPGPRLVDGVEIIAGLLHPACFPEIMGPCFAERWHRCRHN